MVVVHCAGELCTCHLYSACCLVSCAFWSKRYNSRRLCIAKVTGFWEMYMTHLGGYTSAWRGVDFVCTISRCLCCNSLSNDARFRREDLHVKVCPWCGVGLLFLYLFFTRSATSYKITLLFGLAAPVKLKGVRGEVRSQRPLYYVPCSI